MALVEPEHFGPEQPDRPAVGVVAARSLNRHFFVSRGWAYEPIDFAPEPTRIQLEKVAAQVRRPMAEGKSKSSQDSFEESRSSLRRRMETLKAASFVLSAFSFGGVILALLLIGSAYAAGITSSFPRNIVVLILSLFFLLASRRLRSRVSVYLRSQNI